MELRCPSRLFGIIAEGRFEVKCRSSRCGASKDVTVLHYFDPMTGELLETLKFDNAERLFRGGTNNGNTANNKQTQEV